MRRSNANHKVTSFPFGFRPLRRSGAVAVACAVLGASVALTLLAPAGALAGFTRPGLCSTAAGVLSEAQGVAVDGQGHLWVSQSGKNTTTQLPIVGVGYLLEFDSACKFLGPNPGPSPLEIEGLTLPTSLAIEGSTGNFYVTGQSRGDYVGYVEVFDNAGHLVKRWDHQFDEDRVAVDNSTDPLDPSAGSVYVAHRQDQPEPAGDSLPVGIERLSTEGKLLGFTATVHGKGCEKYIEQGEIVGNEEECVGQHDGGFGALTVDSSGNIYAIFTNSGNQEQEANRGVDEYRPDGSFVRAFTGGETPGLNENREYGGFGGTPSGVAVDPVTGDVLVSFSSGLQGAVDEFDSSGHFVTQITTAPDGTSFVKPVQMAVDSTGNVYVLDDGIGTEGRNVPPRVDVYGPGAFLPGVKIVEASERGRTGALLSGSVDPEGQPLSDCHFDYVTEAAFAKSGFAAPASAPCEPSAATIGAASTYVPVSARLSGLPAGTTYRFRLVASSTGSLGGTSASEPLTFTTLSAPRVNSMSVSNISSEFVDLHAQIAPLGSATTYQFEYVEAGRYDPAASDPYAAGTSLPVSPAAIGSGGTGGGQVASVVQQAGGLLPATTYDFRVVATSKIEGQLETTPGPNGTFTTLAGALAGLPDGRGYELVTPADKGGAADMFGKAYTSDEYENGDVGFSSDSGDGFLLETYAAFGPFPASVHNAYVFRRDPQKGEWTFTSLVSPSLGVQSVTGVAFDPTDLSRVAVNDFSGSVPSEAGIKGVNLYGAPGGPYTDLHVDAPNPRSSEEQGEGTTVVGASSDLSHVVLESLGHGLCGESQDAGSNVLCEWSGGYETVNGESKPELNLVDAKGEGSALLNKCGAVLGSFSGASGFRADNAVSADGSKVFFTSPDPFAHGAGCWKPETTPQTNPPELYLRSDRESLEVSAPEAGIVDPTGAHPAVFVGASEDGSKVFFMTVGELTHEALELKLHDPELYEYDTRTGELTRVSAAIAGSADAGGGANVRIVPAVSADGSAVYFTALGRLTPDAPAVTGEQVNLYRFDTTASSGKLSYIAAVNAEDYPYNQPNSWTEGSDLKILHTGLDANADWYTTPDGRYLLFATNRELKEGYSTAGRCRTQNASNDNPSSNCAELYRYDADSKNLACVSCNPSGASPVSNSFFARSVSSSSVAGPPASAMSDDGSYVFFDTADALVPQDTNGTLDVYEWHEGKLALISSGKDPAPSFFLGASPDGSNVFFGTHARLVPRDTDTNGDVYDARICSVGDPCLKPALGGTGLCEGDACQNAPVVPIDTPPISLTFSGPGNAQEQPKAQIAPKSLPSSTEKFAQALKACRKKPKSRRGACERGARKRYAKKATRARHARASGRAGK